MNANSAEGRTILVTGGTGFLGRNLIRGLLRRGAVVRTLHAGSRGPRAGLEDLAGRVEFHIGDVRDAETTRRAARGVDAIVHLAAINGTREFYRRPHEVLDVSVRGMLSVIDACRSEGVRDLFVASSPEVYQTPPTIPTGEDVPLIVPDLKNPRYSYGGGKILLELMATHHGCPGLSRSVVVRPHNVYGPGMGRQHAVSQLIARVWGLSRETGPGAGPLRLPIQGTGHETRAFLYIDDLVRGFLAVVERGESSGIYHVGSDQETTIADLACSIGHHFGREVEVVPGDAPEGAPARRCPDIAKLRSLGFSPETTLDEGLSRTILAFRYGEA